MNPIIYVHEDKKILELVALLGRYTLNLVVGYYGRFWTVSRSHFDWSSSPRRVLDSFWTA